MSVEPNIIKLDSINQNLLFEIDEIMYSDCVACSKSPKHEQKYNSVHFILHHKINRNVEYFQKPILEKKEESKCAHKIHKNL